MIENISLYHPDRCGMYVNWGKEFCILSIDEKGVHPCSVLEGEDCMRSTDAYIKDYMPPESVEEIKFNLLLLSNKKRIYPRSASTSKDR